MSTKVYNTFAEVQRTCTKVIEYDITDFDGKNNFEKHKQQIETSVGDQWETTIAYPGFEIQYNSGYYIIIYQGIHALYKSIRQYEYAEAQD